MFIKYLFTRCPNLECKTVTSSSQPKILRCQKLSRIQKFDEKFELQNRVENLHNRVA